MIAMFARGGNDVTGTRQLRDIGGARRNGIVVLRNRGACPGSLASTSGADDATGIGARRRTADVAGNHGPHQLVSESGRRNFLMFNLMPIFVSQGPGHMMYSKHAESQHSKIGNELTDLSTEYTIICMCCCHLIMLDETALRILTKTKDYDDDTKLSECGKEV
ncbi:hypothetical protein BJX65DRAFT_271700 [Aspergillus insuetus]